MLFNGLPSFLKSRLLVSVSWKNTYFLIQSFCFYFMFGSVLSLVRVFVFYCLFGLVFFSLLRTEPRAFYMLGRTLTTKLHLQSCFLSFLKILNKRNTMTKFLFLVFALAVR